MHKLIKIVGYAVASAGIAYAVKKIVDHKKCRCGWHKVELEDEKSAETASHETKEEGEKTTGSRYGSNPVKY